MLWEKYGDGAATPLVFSYMLHKKHSPPPRMQDGWWAGWLVGWLAGLVGWLGGWWAGWLGWLAGLAGWCWLASWLVLVLVVLVVWLAGWVGYIDLTYNRIISHIII